MRHKFGNIPIPEGQDKIEQVCQNGCGIARTKTKSGVSSYKTIKGESLTYVPTCSGVKNKEYSILTTNTIRKLTKLPDENLSIDLRDYTKELEQTNKKDKDDARLQESIVFLKLAYEEMIALNFKGKSRLIIKRFLESQKLKEWVKELDNRSKIVENYSIS